VSSQSVLQSGQITPSHAAVWVTDGVIKDGGATPASQRVLASLRGANFNTTNDQPIAIPLNFTAFQLNGIIITNASISLTSAVGGFYPQPAKAGTPIVSAAQAYSALTTPASLLAVTLAAFGANTRFSAANLGSIGGFLMIWLSLTTPQGAPALADVYLTGTDLS
jgi:hypothetical protein